MTGEQDVPEKAKVAEWPEKLHPIVAETKRQYRGLKPYNGQRKVASTGLIDTVGGGTVWLHVSPASLDRALRIADTLLKAAEARGHGITLDGKGEHAGIAVEGQFVAFQLLEGTKRFAHIPAVTEEKRHKRVLFDKLSGTDALTGSTTGKRGRGIRQQKECTSTRSRAVFAAFFGRCTDAGAARVGDRPHEHGLLHAFPTATTSLHGSLWCYRVDACWH